MLRIAPPVFPRRVLGWTALACLCLVPACGSGPSCVIDTDCPLGQYCTDGQTCEYVGEGNDAGSGEVDAALVDAAGPSDAGVPNDTGAPGDSGTPFDGGPPGDVGPPLGDSGPPSDAGPATDGGPDTDAGDPGVDGGGCGGVPGNYTITRVPMACPTSATIITVTRTPPSCDLELTATVDRTFGGVVTDDGRGAFTGGLSIGTSSYPGCTVTFPSRAIQIDCGGTCQIPGTLL